MNSQMYRRMTALAAFLSCMLFVLLFDQSAALAQRCVDSGCNSITIYNCTTNDFKVKFSLCCNGFVTESDAIAVPASRCSRPIQTANFAPCSVLGLSIIAPTPPPGVTVMYNPSLCSLFIF